MSNTLKLNFNYESKLQDNISFHHIRGSIKHSLRCMLKDTPSMRCMLKYLFMLGLMLGLMRSRVVVCKFRVQGMPQNHEFCLITIILLYGLRIGENTKKVGKYETSIRCGTT